MDFRLNVDTWSIGDGVSCLFLKFTHEFQKQDAKASFDLIGMLEPAQGEGFAPAPAAHPAPDGVTEMVEAPVTAG